MNIPYHAVINTYMACLANTINGLYNVKPIAVTMGED